MFVQIKVRVRGVYAPSGSLHFHVRAGRVLGGGGDGLSGLTGESEFRRVVALSCRTPPPSGLVGERSPSFGPWTGPIDAE